MVRSKNLFGSLLSPSHGCRSNDMGEFKEDFDADDFGVDESDGGVDADAEVAAEGGGVDPPAGGRGGHYRKCLVEAGAGRHHCDDVACAAVVKADCFGFAHQFEDPPVDQDPLCLLIVTLSRTDNFGVGPARNFSKSLSISITSLRASKRVFH